MIEMSPKGKIFNNFCNLRRNGHNILYAVKEHGVDARQMWIYSPPSHLLPI